MIEPERLHVLCHELRSPVAALEALAAARGIGHGSDGAPATRGARRRRGP